MVPWFASLHGYLGRLAEQMAVTTADRLNLLTEKFVHLLRRTTDELATIQHGSEIHTRQQRIGLQAIQKIVFIRASLQGGRNCLAMTADALVDLLAISAVSDRRHQEVLRRHVRKNGGDVAGDHLRIDDQAIADVQGQTRHGVGA